MQFDEPKTLVCFLVIVTLCRPESLVSCNTIVVYRSGRSSNHNNMQQVAPRVVKTHALKTSRFHLRNASQAEDYMYVYKTSEDCDADRAAMYLHIIMK